MGLSIVTNKFNLPPYGGIHLRIYKGLIARLLNRPLAFGYVARFPDRENYNLTIWGKGLYYEDTAPTLQDGIQAALSRVHE